MDGARNRAGEEDEKEVVDHPSSPEGQRRSNSTSAAREDRSLDAAAAVDGVEGSDAAQTDAVKRDRARRANHHADVGMSANRNSYPYARYDCSIEQKS